jgi:hypothetical protein
MMNCRCLPDTGSAKGQVFSRFVLAVVSMTISWAGGVGMAQGQSLKVPPGAATPAPDAPGATAATGNIAWWCQAGESTREFP